MPAHGPGAALGQAARALPVVDAEPVLEISKASIGPGKIPQSRAAGLDRRAEGRDDRRGQTFAPGPAAPARQCPGGTKWRKARKVQGLADIYIAEPGDDALIQQHGFERRSTVRKGGVEHRFVEPSAKRLETEMCQKPVVVPPAWFDQIHEAEAPGVGIADAGRPVLAVTVPPTTCPGGACHVEHDMLMGRGEGRIIVKSARPPRRRACLYSEPAGHAEMHEQRGSIIESGEDIFGAPFKRGDAAPFEACREALGKRKPKIRASLLDTGKSGALHRGP